MGTVGSWRVRTSRTLRVVDAFVILWAVAGAYVIRFGLEATALAGADDYNYLLLSVVISVAWWLMLEAWNSRQPRVLGSGPDEYKRVAAASLWLFGLVAIISYVFRLETARGYVGIALPVLSLAERAVVVGDDQQIGPQLSFVGSVQGLIQRHLTDVPSAQRNVPSLCASFRPIHTSPTCPNV